MKEFGGVQLSKSEEGVNGLHAFEFDFFCAPMIHHVRLPPFLPFCFHASMLHLDVLHTLSLHSQINL